MLVAFGVLLFLGMRVLMQRQAQRMNTRLQEQVTPEAARQAVLALDDEQHKEVYRAIAAEDGRRALAVYRQSTGASVRDCVVAVQALHRFPQPSPSEIQFDQNFNLNGEDHAGGVSAQGEDQVDDEYVEDAIDQVRSDSDSGEPLAEADPHSGEILGDNPHQVPSVPSSEANDDQHPDDVDARARELMAQSGFDPDQELTVPEEWGHIEEELSGFHLELQRGDEKIVLSHDDLEPWVHDQLYALLRDDHLDEAAELLAGHSPLTTGEAHQFLVALKGQS